MEQLEKQERQEREFCHPTPSLQHQVYQLRKESYQRRKNRKDILKLLTTAAEELDALPEELISKLSKILHDIDDADKRTADLVTMEDDDEIDGETRLSTRKSNRANSSNLHQFPRQPPTRRKPMTKYPIDAQRISVSLTSIRKKLGEIPLTTLLRIKNLADEPLRLKSGVQLKEGKYLHSFKNTRR